MAFIISEPPWHTIDEGDHSDEDAYRTDNVPQGQRPERQESITALNIMRTYLEKQAREEKLSSRASGWSPRMRVPLSGMPSATGSRMPTPMPTPLASQRGYGWTPRPCKVPLPVSRRCGLVAAMQPVSPTCRMDPSPLGMCDYAGYSFGKVDPVLVRTMENAEYACTTMDMQINATPDNGSLASTVGAGIEREVSKITSEKSASTDLEDTIELSSTTIATPSDSEDRSDTDESQDNTPSASGWSPRMAGVMPSTWELLSARGYTPIMTERQPSSRFLMKEMRPEPLASPSGSGWSPRMSVPLAVDEMPEDLKRAHWMQPSAPPCRFAWMHEAMKSSHEAMKSPALTESTAVGSPVLDGMSPVGFSPTGSDRQYSSGAFGALDS